MIHVKLLRATMALALSVSFTAGGSGILFAQEDVTPRDREALEEQRMHLEQQRADLQERLEMQRMQAQEQRNTVRTENQQRLDAHRMQMQTRADEARQRLEQRHAETLERRDEMRRQIETRREEMRQRWEARKAELSERRKVIINNHIERIIQRMQSAIDRLARIADKIKDRIASLEGQGADVSVLEALLADARAAIAAAQTELDAAAADLRGAPDTDNPPDAIGNARVRFESVKAALRQAHAALVEVIKEIKKGQLIPAEVGEEGEGATTTDAE